ncbi:MAG: hypothetical protein HOE69_00065 [Euryarchaeota archaeon]|jgi:hypothetical protein|nr:hypothetical protein [Euryarchaeota archaeon]
MNKKQRKRLENSKKKHLVLESNGPPHRFVGDEQNLELLDCSNMTTSLPTIALKNNPNLNQIIFDRAFSSYNIVTNGPARQIKNGKRRQIANLKFIDTPPSDVKIDGQIGEIMVNHNGRQMTSGIGKQRLTSLESAKNAFISQNPSSFNQMSDFEFGILLLSDNDTNKKISLGEGVNLRHLTVIGPSICENITINVPEGAERIVVKNMPNLKSVTLNGSTKILEVINCIRLDSVSGFGQHILFENSGSNDVLNLDGFWMDIVHGPAWNIIARTSKLTSHNLEFCSDLSFVKVLPTEYDTFITWCEILDVDSIQLGEGIPIPDLVNAILKSGVHNFDKIIDWFDGVLALQEQYYAMRILVALAKRGFSKRLVWAARQKVIHNNFELSRSQGTLISHSRASIFNWIEAKKVNKLVKEGSSSPPDRCLPDEYYWTTPSRSFIPFERLDVEIWLSCYESMKNIPAYPSAEKILGSRIVPGRWTISTAITGKQLSRVPSSKKLLALLDSSHLNADNMGVRNAIGEAIDVAIKILEEYGDSSVFEYLALFAIENCYFNIEAFVDAIVKSNLLGTREKSALLCGMIYYSDDISIRIKLMQLMSDMSLTREESREINILATCGKRGHLEKGIKPLRWPFIVSWRKKHGR